MWKFLMVCVSVLLVKAEGTYTTEEAIEKIRDQVNTTRISEFITKMTKLPRNTNSDFMKQKTGDLKRIFRALGLKVVTKRYNVLQCFPDKSVDKPSFAEITAKGGSTVYEFSENGDAEKKILPAFNAWSKSGTVEGEPVYVNYGRKEDFEKLVEMGSDLKGTIGIARYGKIYRGDKAKFAKRYGLIGLIIYNDIKDYSPQGIDPMPNGEGLPSDGIQRGTLKDGLGDPTTQLWPSTKYAYRSPEEEYEKLLPGIVVMPIGHDNAIKLLYKLKGDNVDGDWQGGHKEKTEPYKYGPGFTDDSGYDRIKINVALEYKVVEVENVFAVVRGSVEPDRWVMVGNHRDTWVNGAVDATTGLATLHEVAHGLSQLMKEGWSPRRTIVLASWAAEEQGILGSYEFVEEYLELLRSKLVAYINVDVAASGNLNFKPGATPNFKTLLEAATKAVGSSHDDYKDKTFYDQWYDTSVKKSGLKDKFPVINNLGSGSDYAGFLQTAGVSSIDLTIIGNYFTYHTEYDNIKYLGYIDPGFRGVKAVTEVATYLLLELADQKIVPLKAVDYSSKVKELLNQEEEKYKTVIESNGFSDLFGMLNDALDTFVAVSEEYDNRSPSEDNASKIKLRRYNDQMLQMERSFIFAPGLPSRPQNRHVLFAPSLLNSYSGAVFPGIFDSLASAAEAEEGSDERKRLYNQAKKQVTIATWMVKQSTRSLSNAVFPM